MNAPIRPLIAGNWKMNGMDDWLEDVRTIAERFDDSCEGRADGLLCVPATLLHRAVETARNHRLAIGGEDCHSAESGAHTGDISAEMVADCGATHVIVGHSERRTDHGETSEAVSDKASAAWRAGLTAIICIGETESEREAGRTLDILRDQIAASIPDGATAATTVIAYEPVWAIGTGRTPTVEDVGEAHGFIRERLVERFGEEGKAMRVLYGGSVKRTNAGELLAIENVNGALIGGASLKVLDFLGIAEVLAD